MSTPQENNSSEFQLVLRRLAVDSAMALFRAYGVWASPTDPATGKTAGETRLATVTHFSAKGVSATLVLGCTIEPLRRSNRFATADGDWIGELANQLFGRMKTKLLASGLELKADSTAVAQGDQVATVLAAPDVRPTFLCGSDGGAICVSVSAQVAYDFVLSGKAPIGEILAEGQVVLF